MAIRVRWRAQAGGGGAPAPRMSGADPVGAALERFGQQLGGAVADVGGAMARKKQMQDEARTRAMREFDDNALKDAQAALTARRIELSRHDSGYRAERGGAAVTQTTAYTDGLAATIEELQGALPDRTRRDFARYAGAEFSEFSAEIDGHVARESDVFLGESHKARMKTHSDALAETIGVGSPMVASMARKQANMIAVLEHDEAVTRLGGSGEAALARSIAAATDAVERGGLAALNQGLDPDSVEATVAGLKDHVDVDALAAGPFGKRLVQVRDEREMSAVVEAALGAGGDDGALAVINKSNLSEQRKQDARGLYIARATDRKRLVDLADAEGLGRIEQALLTTNTHPRAHADFAGLTDAHQADALRMWDSRLRSLRAEGSGDLAYQNARDSLILGVFKGLTDEEQVTAKLAMGLFADLSPKAREAARLMQNSTVKAMQRSPALSGQALESVIAARLDESGVTGKNRRKKVSEKVRASVAAARAAETGGVPVFSLEDIHRFTDEANVSMGFFGAEPGPVAPGRTLTPGGGGEIDPTKPLPEDIRSTTRRRKPLPPGRVYWRNKADGSEWSASADKAPPDGWEIVR